MPFDGSVRRTSSTVSFPAGEHVVAARELGCQQRGVEHALRRSSVPELSAAGRSTGADGTRAPMSIARLHDAGESAGS
jgi:hypothetical protein